MNTVLQIAGKTANAAPRAKPHSAGRAQLLAGAAIVAVLCGGMGIWATTVEISGAVVAPGTVVVDNYPKIIQHATGGPVAAVLVHDGDHVNAGDVVLRIDDTIARTNYEIIASQIAEVAARVTRLKAEIADNKQLATKDFALGPQSKATDQAMAEEITLFRSRLAGRLTSKQQCSARVQQARADVTGLQAQRTSKLRERELAQKELSGLEELEGKSLVGMTKITAARRGIVQLDGDLARIDSSEAQANGRISEHEAMLAQVDHDFKSDAGKQLSEQQAQLAELRERQIAAEDQLAKSEIRAPVTGIVNKLAVHSTGGVVNPGQPLMEIVPAEEGLVIEAKVAPEDIDQIAVGGEASIKFTAFNRQNTPDVPATVTRVSADVLRRDANNPAAAETAPHYLARLQIKAGEQAEAVKNLIAGMPAEVFFKTGDRTPLSYFMKPLTDQFARAFRQE